MLDLDRFDIESVDAGRVTPVPGPVSGSTPLPPAQAGDGPETARDAGSEPPAQPLPTEQPATQSSPIALPPTRPVLVSSVLTDSTYAGTQAGGERRAGCGGGSVMVGVSFYYYAAGVGDRLGFLAPICGRFGDDPAAPLEWARDDAAVFFWPMSDVLLGGPPAPLARQSLGELVCPAGLVVAGARGNMDPDTNAPAPTYIIRDVTLECAPAYEVLASSQVVVDRAGATVIAASVLPFAGVEQYSIGCDGGNVAAGLFESTGSWVDGFALSCTALRRPRVAGDACNAGDACQSGVCEASGSCAAVAQ